MTPLEIETAARNRYNAIGDQFYSTDMIMDLIYDASLQLTTEADVIERKYTTTSTANTREYSYPTNAKSIRKVTYKGYKLRPKSLEYDPKTDLNDPTGTPGEYAIWNDELYLFPTPDTTGDTIEVYTFNRPQPVTTTSTLEVPEDYHMDIVKYVLSYFYAKDGNESMANFLLNQWERSVLRAKRHNAKRKHGDQYGIVRDDMDTPYYPWGDY